ncbi:MAG: LamG domain-containing protein [Bacteroidota bacterium]
MKTDNDGNAQWAKEYSIDNNTQDAIITDIIEDSNQDILVTAHVAQASVGSNSFSPFIIKTNNNGNLIWSFRYQHPNAQGYGETLFNSIVQSQAGDYYVTGSQAFGSGYLPIIMRIQANGQLVWLKQYSIFEAHGSTIKELNGSIIVSLEGTTGILTTDLNGLNANIYTYAGVGTGQGLETDGGDVLLSGHVPGLASALFLTKIDMSNNPGSVLWSKKYDVSPSPHNGTVTRVSDGYLLQGIGNGMTILKTNSNGETQWVKEIGGNTIVHPTNYITGHNLDAPTSFNDDGFAFTSIGPGLSIFLARADAAGNTPCNQFGLNVIETNVNTQGNPSQTSGTDIAFNVIPASVQETSVTYNKNDECRQLNCTPPPPEVTAWYPFDQTTDDIVGGNHAASVNTPVYQIGLVSSCIKLNGTSDYLTVANSTANNFGTNSFSIDFWINLPNNGNTGKQVILDKVSGNGVGYSVFVDNGVLQSYLSDGTTQGTQSSNYSLYSNSGWHFATLTVDRLNGVLNWYVDGVAQTTFNILTFNGSFSNNSPMIIGADANQNNYLDGFLDEIELFDKALDIGEINRIRSAGSNGKCKSIVTAPSCQSICLGASSVNVPISICNYSSQSKTYTLEAIYGLPIGAQNGFCNEAGPTSYSAANPTVTVAPFSCGIINTTIPRPVGLDAVNDRACFQVTVTDNNGIAYWADGCILDRRDICLTVPNEPNALIELTPSETTTVSIVAENTTKESIQMDYVWKMDESNQRDRSLSIDQKENSIELKPNEKKEISIGVNVKKHLPFKTFNIGLEAKTQSDSTYKNLMVLKFVTRTN